MTRAAPGTGRAPAGRRKSWSRRRECVGWVEDSECTGEPSINPSVRAKAAASPASANGELAGE